MFIRSLLKHLPLRCDLCHLELSKQEKEQGFAWCNICYQSLPRDNRCLRCGLPTIKDMDACGHCLMAPPRWDNLRCIDSYQFPYDKLIHRFKYQGQFWLGKTLASLLLKEITTSPSMLIPVPMHWQRQIFRGYNQSHILAIHLAKKLNCPCNAQAVTRTRITQQQQGLSRKERLVNLRNAFNLNQSLPKHIALVDDVVTTGSTIGEICKLLKKHNVEKIDVYCITRSASEKL